MRNKELDIVKGIGIFCVVLGHCAHFSPYVNCYIYSFHIPLFFILSGYFYRSNYGYLGNAVKLWAPAIITTLVCCALYALFGKYDNAFVRLSGLLYPNSGEGIGSVWFLPALFWCRIFADFVIRIWPKHYLLASIVFSWICVFIGQRFFNLPLGILVGCTGVLPYALGYYAKKHSINERKIPCEVWLVFYVIWIFFCRFYNLGMYSYSYSILLYPIQIFVAAGVVLFIYNFSKEFVKYTNPLAHTITTVLCWMGMHSLLILCCHEVCMKLIHLTNNVYPFTDKIAGILLLSLSFIVAFLVFGVNMLIKKKGFLLK